MDQDSTQAGGGARSRSGRALKPTEAGQEYQTESKMQVYKRHLQHLKRRATRLFSEDGTDILPDVDKEALDNWMHTYVSFVQTELDLQHLMAEEELEKHKRDHGEVMERFNRMKNLVQDRQTELKGKRHASAPSIASQSVKSGSCKSVRSGLKLMRAQDEHRKAEAAAKLAMLEKKRQLEKQQQELKWKEEELEIRTEMEIHKLQTEVVDKYEKDLDAESEKIDTSQAQPVTSELPPQTGEEPASFADWPLHSNTDTVGAGSAIPNVPNKTEDQPGDPEGRQNQIRSHQKPKATSDVDVLAGLADLLSEQMKKASLPALEPEIFRGDVEQFHLWSKSFESYIEARTSSPTERLHFLARYTGGEARNAIQGFLHLRSEDAYARAKAKLADRYGNDFVTAATYKKRLRKWPRISAGDGKALTQLADFLESCEVASETVTGLKTLGDPSENAKILNLLPKHIVSRWERIVDERLYEPPRGSSGHYPDLSEFVRFLRKEARVASGPISVQATEDVVTSKPTPRRSTSRNKAGTFASTAADAISGGARAAFGTTGRSEPTFRALKCCVCGLQHALEFCKEFSNMSIIDRHAEVVKHSLCRGCLKPGHVWRVCNRKKRCDKCNRLHPTLLHDDSVGNASREGVRKSCKDEGTQTRATSLQVNVSEEHSSCAHSMVVPVRLRHKKHPEHEIVTYALLDLQSDACFIKGAVQDQIHADGEAAYLQLSTMTGKSVVKSCAIQDLVVQTIEGSTEIDLPTTFSRSDIPAERSLIPRKDTVQEWAHLEKVAEDLPPYFSEADVGILIGVNCPRAVKPQEVVSGDDDDAPWAVRTALGWSVVGLVGCAPSETDSSGSASERRSGRTACHFAFKVSTQEVSPAHVLHLFESDFQDALLEKKLSQEDIKFVNMMENGIHQREDSHFELPLPLKDPSFKFPNNKQVAMKRLMGLKGRLSKDPKFREDYEAFMNDMLNKGYAEPVPHDELEHDSGKVWYVPHHGVYHPKKEKIRIVFDCSAEHQGTSLNSQLMQGPDTVNNLTGVLVRFRKHEVGLSCDVEGMFNQVGVNTEHRNLLRFLWWKGGDVTSEPEEYRMTTHLFGATSSPACAMYALNETANKYESDYGEAAAEFVRQDFYVDDGLTSTPDEESAVKLATDTIKLCAGGGFNLHKFVSNDQKVLQQLPVFSLAKNLQEVEFTSGRPLLEQALGITWDLRTDTFRYNLNLPDKPATRRGLLSVTSSLFDPVGFISPFVLEGKKILKQLCCDGCGWDDPVPEDVLAAWESWKSDIPHLSQIEIPRCYSPFKSESIKAYELHHFCDASLSGYGHCSYLRTITEEGLASSSLVMSKARVTPKRPMTVPRLELTAALSAVKASCFLRRELGIADLKEVFWTDSKVVLGYINNETKRFHVFVSNRVQQIRQATSPNQWRHIATEENPADLTSRGTGVSELIHNDLWWHGPSFLREPGDVPPDETQSEVQEGDPEVKTSSVFTVEARQVSNAAASYASLPERLKYFSSWFRAKRAVAVLLRYKRILQNQVKSKTGGPESLKNDLKRSDGQKISVNVEELKEAEMVILRSVQREEFEEEFKTLEDHQRHKADNGETKRSLKRESALHRLDPFIGDDGLLRVGGRIQRADVPAEVAHPAILPNRSHVTDVIVEHVHNQVKHAGRETTLSEIRLSGYWIVRGRTAVSRCILRCTKCIRLRGTPCSQKMSDLPQERVEEAEPFTFSAVDYFGPFYIREKRSEVKRWGVIFTCMSSRSIHLETANSMTSDAFLNAYRRFIGRRGPVRRLFCDQGSNFIGGKGLLKAALKEADHQRIKEELLKENCDWVEFRFNVPHASHMGGVWERQIRTARAVLSSILDTHGRQLDDELLRTVMVETEAIVNSRPLSYTSMSDTNTLEPITPQQILTLKSKVVCPLPGRFCVDDLYAARRWRRVQFLANNFWTRWRREFLPTLQERKKWQHPRRNLEEGDVVVVVDDAAPRINWPIGRIVTTYPSSDGLVRKVRVQIKQAQYDRPIHRLILLLKNPDAESEHASV